MPQKHQGIFEYFRKLIKCGVAAHYFNKGGNRYTTNSYMLFVNCCFVMCEHGPENVSNSHICLTLRKYQTTGIY